jgi:hypothetical protein
MGAYMRPALLCATLASRSEQTNHIAACAYPPSHPLLPAHKRIPRPAIHLSLLRPPLVIAPATDLSDVHSAVFVSQGPTTLVPVLLHLQSRIPCIVTSDLVTTCVSHIRLDPGTDRSGALSHCTPHGIVKDGRPRCNAT